jgi:hypothetical protein
MERPKVWGDYLDQAERLPQTSSVWRPLLIILDLNGTLLKRTQRGGSKFNPRPGLADFLTYIFNHHRVMVWSSARCDNVEAMCRTVFTQQQNKDLIAVWSREDLRLSAHAFDAHCQVYKQLVSSTPQYLEHLLTLIPCVYRNGCGTRSRFSGRILFQERSGAR